MQYFKVEGDDDKWVMYDPEGNSSMVISKAEVEKQLEMEKTWLKTFTPMNDESLLKWAREQNPTQQDYDMHMASKKAKEELLDQLK